MDYSYWEYKTWLSDIDYTIIGSGIVGLSCALQLRAKYPAAKIVVLERGVLPNGASTKNAGFACFGSLSEILDDLNSHSEDEVVQLVEKRWKGLELLRKQLGDDRIRFKQYGGYELFTEDDKALYKECIDKLDRINTLLYPIFKQNVFSCTDNTFEFKNIQPQYIFNQFEGQIDTGAMMNALVQKAQNHGIYILNNCTVQEIEDQKK